MPWTFLYKQFGTSNNNQDQVLSHLVMTVHRLFQSFTTQILMFMRYGLVVGDKEVVAVVLSDIEDPLTYPRAEIKGKLDGRLARTCQKYYFTARFRFPIYTVGGGNDWKRKYFFYSHFLPSELAEELRNGNCIPLLFHNGYKNSEFSLDTKMQCKGETGETEEGHRRDGGE